MSGRGRKVATHYERRRRALHERILAAALDRFENQGIGATRIDDICAKAGIAQKTFFNHFPSKQHVVREIAQRFLHGVLATIEAVRRMPGPTGKRIEQLFEQTARRARSAPPMRRALVVEVIGTLHGDPRQTELAATLRRAIGGMLRDGVRAGEVTSAHSLPVLARVVAGSFYALMLDWASIDGFPLRARARAVARFLVDALATRPSRPPQMRGSARSGRSAGASRDRPDPRPGGARRSSQEPDRAAVG
jgi:AcrR family transcriptional regulator